MTPSSPQPPENEWPRLDFRPMDVETGIGHDERHCEV
jgi:hypothetical protein